MKTALCLVISFWGPCYQNKLAVMKLWLHKYACYQNKLAVWLSRTIMFVKCKSFHMLCPNVIASWLWGYIVLTICKKKKNINVFTFCLCGLYCADILQTLFTARFWQAHLNLGMEEACWDWWRLDPLELPDPSIFVAVVAAAATARRRRRRRSRCCRPRRGMGNDCVRVARVGQARSFQFSGLKQS